MLESLNTGVFEYEKLKPEEMKARGILGRLVGVMADTVNPTRNGRAYSEKLWENVFNNPIMQERIENKCCFGELGHPLDREETDMEKIAICMDGVPKKDNDGKLQAVFNILDTPNGRILKTLCDYGCNIGISSRGSGDLIEDFDGNESVDPDTYNCEGWDAVLIPAVKEARLKYVNESLEKKRYNKSLRTRLQEAVEKEDVDKKKAMTESLHTFLGESIWDEIEGTNVEEPEAGPEPDPDFVDGLESNMEGGESAPEDDLGDILGEPSEEGDIPDDEPLDLDLGGLDEPMDLGPEKINYKGVDIVKDSDSGKFVCEIDQETYVFNTEKNAKIWIDMNEKDVKEDNIEDAVSDFVETEVEGDNPEEEETFEEEPVVESLNEEQVGRDKTKDDKDPDEVQEPEKDKDEEEKDDKKKKVTVTIDESIMSDAWNNLNGTEQMATEAVRDYIERGNNDPLDMLVHQAVSMYNEANAFTDDVDDEEADYNKVYNFVKQFILNEDFNENTNDSTLNYNEIDSNEAGNIGAEVDSLQEMLEYNLQLEKKIIKLQEKLSVSHAEENRLTEEVASLKEKIAKLSKVSKENIALKEQIKTLKDSSTKLNESVTKNSNRVQSLTEQLMTVKEERDSANTELETIKEQYASLDKDATQIKEQLTTKVENQNKLLEKYQKITKSAVDRYINLQATNLGVRPAEIKNKLPEKFSFGEIDSICEELREYKLSVSKLPFDTSKSLREGKVKVNNLSRGLAPKNETDELTDIDLKLMEMFK